MNQEENALVTRTGPGTPMGELMRQYWLPAALSAELVADGPPVRMMLLGERLIAFRDSAGRIGIMDHRCPHRCASLFFGRNEESGIRCVYHGWKFDVDGNCLEQPNVPAQHGFADKVKAKAYLATERNGLVWVYMGDRARAPALPPFEATGLTEDQVGYRFVQRDCNWLQAIEGDLDTSHVGFLHFGAARPNALAGDSQKLDLVKNRAPEYKVADTDYGLIYGGYRPSEFGGTYWRIAHFLYPVWIMPPVSGIADNVMVRAFIPLDDDHCMFVEIAHKDYLRSTMSNQLPGGTLNDNFRPNTSDWLGRWRLVENRANDYLIERDVQDELSFTGIEGIHVQDQAVTESMGAIVDRSLEHLAPSDVAIGRFRRALLRNVRGFVAGQRPPAADTPEAYAHVRGGHYVSPETGDWLAMHQAKVANTPGLLGADAAE
jgi:phthalate 4,5-dioxygenase oxygenase subunit